MKPNLEAAGCRQRRLYLFASGAIILAAAALRIIGALNDLWLDEIGSLELASEVRSPVEVFTRFHSEINHPLNTLWLYLAGQHGNWPGYRVPSVLAGIGTVILAGLIGGRRSRSTSLFAMLLTSFSYVLVLYASEARGYSMAVCFSLLSFYLFDLYLEKRRLGLALLFSCSMALAVLAHLASVSVLLATVVWFVFQAKPKAADSSRRGLQAGDALSCFALPFLVLAVFYATGIRQMESAGGNPSQLADTYEAAMAWALGAPLPRRLNLASCVAAFVILSVGLRGLWRNNSGLLAFFVSVILVFPIVLVLIRNSEAIYVRYFLSSITFLILLFSGVLAELYGKGWQGKVLCFTVLSGYLLANGWHLTRLYKFGRGHYAEAARFIAQNSKSPAITIGGDHDVRIPVVLQFHYGQIAAGKEARYCVQGAWPADGVEWIICHKESNEEPVPAGMQITDKAENHYAFVKAFPTAPLSGLHWFLYHNTAK